jgi:hypothetical protein
VGLVILPLELGPAGCCQSPNRRFHRSPSVSLTVRDTFILLPPSL